MLSLVDVHFLVDTVYEYLIAEKELVYVRLVQITTGLQRMCSEGILNRVMTLRRLSIPFPLNLSLLFRGSKNK